MLNPDHMKAVRSFAFAVLFCISLGVTNGAFALSPPLVLTGKNLISGQTIRVDLNDAPKGAVVVFLSAQCPCSASHEQKLRELSAEFTKKGFSFVAVHSNADESAALTKAHFEHSGLLFPVLQDQASILANGFEAIKTPHVFVISHGQTVYQGGVDDSHMAPMAKQDFLRDALMAINDGKLPKVSETRALGCVIKR